MVSNTADNGSGSLRNAIQLASALDTIRFDPSLISTSTATVELDSQITITKPLVIKGAINGNYQVRVSGEDASRIFRINLENSTNKNFTIDSLILIDGDAPGIEMGGAIWFLYGDTLRMSNSQIRSSHAKNGGGIGVSNMSYSGQTALLIDDGVFLGNTATDNGGVVYADGNRLDIVLEDSRFSANQAFDRGGVIYVEVDGIYGSSIECINSEFETNYGALDGGAIHIDTEAGQFDLLISDSCAFLNNYCNSTSSKGGAIHFYSGYFSSNDTHLGIWGGCLFEDNTAGAAGGAVYYDASSTGYADSSFIQNAEFRDNSADEGGAVFYDRGQITIDSSLFVNNDAETGGAVYYLTGNSSYFIRIFHSTFKDNSASGDGGAVYTQGKFLAKHARFYSNHAGGAGGVYCSWDFVAGVTLDSCTVGANSSDSAGGAFYLYSTTTLPQVIVHMDSVLAYSNLSEQEGGLAFVETVHAESKMSIRNSIIHDQSAGDNGGVFFGYSENDLFILDVVNSEIHDNESLQSGGFVYGDGKAPEVFITHSVIESNHAAEEGGAIYLMKHGNSDHILVVDSSLFAGNSAEQNGGAVCSYSNVITPDTYTDVTFDSNSAGEDGGAIFAYTARYRQHYFINCTFNNNSAATDGGAICVKAFPNLLEKRLFIRFDQTTLVNNSAGDDGGAVFSEAAKGYSRMLIFRSTILNNVAGDTAANLFTSAESSMVGGFNSIRTGSSIIYSNDTNNIFTVDTIAVESFGYNVFSDAPSILGSNNDLTMVNPSLLQFGPLQNNGGFTKTTLPVYGSLAINGGNPQDVLDAQNGPIYLIRDIGAAETNHCESFVLKQEEACESFFWDADSLTYDSSGVFNATLTNGANCDSVITLNLTINLPLFNVDSISACDAFYWSANGTVYNADTVDTAILTSQTGCDSLVEMSIHILSSSEVIEVVETCEDSYTWPTNNTSYSQSGNYQWIGVNNAGCDSIRKLFLEISEVDTNISSNGATLTVNVQDSCHWYNCDEEVLAGQSGFTFSPFSSGWYSAIIWKNGCVDTSSCHYITSLGTQLLSENDVRVYPNPANDQLSIVWSGGRVRFSIRNTMGQIVLADKLIVSPLVLDVSQWPSGIYILTVGIGSEVKAISIMIE